MKKRNSQGLSEKVEYENKSVKNVSGKYCKQLNGKRKLGIIKGKVIFSSDFTITEEEFLGGVI
jgi:hypothetical protein